MGNVRAVCERANKWGVRPVIHPHAGGYIEFSDEIAKVVRDIRMRSPVCVWIPAICITRTWTRWSTSKSTPISWITSTSRT